MKMSIGIYLYYSQTINFFSPQEAGGTEVYNVYAMCTHAWLEVFEIDPDKDLPFWETKNTP